MFINKNLRLNNLKKTNTTMNAKISIFVICVEAIIYLLLHNLHDRTFKCLRNQSNTVEVDNYVFCKSPLQFATTMLEVYLKLKSKRPDGVVLPIIAFPFKDRMKKCTRLLMFGR